MTDPIEFVQIDFLVKTIRPDCRQYKQQSLELEGNTIVTVPVPATQDYIANLPEWNNGGIAKLTPKGLKYVTDTLENEYLPEDNGLNASQEVDDTSDAKTWFDDDDGKPTNKKSEDFDFDEW